MKTIAHSETFKTLEYYQNGQLQFAVDINTENNTIAFRRTGQQVADCINRYYTQSGWLSVGLWLGTLFDPGIGVCVATACAVNG